MRDIVSSNIAFLMEAKKRAIGGFPPLSPIFGGIAYM